MQMVEELSANVTELEAAVEEQQQLRKAAETRALGLEEKLQSTVEMATQKMRALDKEISRLRLGKKK
jgi:hypothetical protein